MKDYQRLHSIQRGLWDMPDTFREVLDRCSEFMSELSCPVTNDVEWLDWTLDELEDNASPDMMDFFLAIREVYRVAKMAETLTEINGLPEA